MSSLSYAAAVNNKTVADSSPEHNSSSKNSPLPDKTAYADYYYSTLDFIEPTDFIKPIPQPPRPALLKKRPTADTHSSGIFDNSPYKQGKEFLENNKDKKFIQDSLLIFGNTKQFLNETDLMLHNLTESISLSLNLDTLIQNSRPALQQSIPSHSNSAQLPASDYQQQDSIYQLQGNINNQSQINEESSSGNLMEKILTLQNLLYLIGIIIFYVIIRTIISFMLLPPK